MKQSFVGLKGKDNFLRITRKGRGTRGEYVRVSVAPSAEEVNMVGIVVSKKVSNKAVVRNKVRRRIKSIIDRWFKENCTVGIELVIGANLQAVEAQYKSLKEEIEKILMRLVGSGSDKKDGFRIN